MELRENAVDLESTVSEIETYLTRLSVIAVEVTLYGRICILDRNF